MSWEITRRGIRNLEVRLDAALNQYSRIAANIAGAGQSNGAWPGKATEEGRRNGVKNEGEDHIQMEQEIERMLAEVSLRS